MSTKIRTLVLSLLLLCAALPLAAGDDPVLDRGFTPDGLYDVHDIDAVNQFNGNLTLQVPLGPKYRTNGTLEYSFAAYYNSNFWDFIDHGVSGGPRDHHHSDIWNPIDARADSSNEYEGSEAVPTWTANAGVGWTVSLGELLRDRGGQYFWMGPDGGEHGFYSTLHTGLDQPSAWGEGYTRDGTYLHLKTLAKNGKTYRIVEFPNGIQQRFHCIGTCPASDPWPQFELDQIADPFGNVLIVTHAERPASGPWVWTFIEKTRNQDPASAATHDQLYADGDPAASESLAEVRRHTLTFEVENPAYMHLTRLDLAALGGQTAPYVFNYNTQDTIYRMYGTNWYSSDMVVPFTSPTNGMIAVHLLRGITLPASAGSWAFNYYDSSSTQPDDPETPDNDGEVLYQFNYNNYWWYLSRFSGRLRRVTGPTGGSTDYRYAARPFSHHMCGTKGPGAFAAVAVSKRTRTEMDGSVSRWLYDGQQYRQQLTPTCNAQVELLSTMIDPLGNATVSFYSTFVGDAHGTSTDVYDDPPYDRREFGMPFSKAQPVAAGDDRYISTEVYRCDAASFLGLSAAAFSDRVKAIVSRPAGVAPSCGNAVRTTYVKFEHGDFNCDGDATTCFAANRRLARERTVYHDDRDAAGGNEAFADSDWTGFDGVGHYRTLTRSGGGMFSASPVRIETTNYNPGASVTNLPAVWLLETYDSQTWTEGNARARAAFQFNAKSGFMESRRDLLQTGSATADPDLNGRDVLKTWQRYRDQDGTIVVTEEKLYGGDLLPIGATPEFQRISRSQYGTQSSSSHRLSSGELVHFTRTIDRWTGLVTSERALSGLGARYEYDVYGRLTRAYHVDARYVAASAAGAIGGEASLGLAYKAGTSPADLATVTLTRPSGCSTGCSQQTTHTYDPYGRLYRTDNAMPGTSQKARKQRTYNGDGWLASESTVRFANDGVRASTYDQYDPFGRAGRIKDPAGALSMELTYGGTRIIARKQYGVAAVSDDSKDDPTTQPNPTTWEEYDLYGRLTRLTDWSETRPAGAGGYPSTALAVYEYDVMGRLASADLRGYIDAASGVTKHQRRTFTYDNRGFLTSELQPEVNATVRYTYDSAGHVRSRAVDGSPSSRLTYVYDEAERLTDVTGVGPTGQSRAYTVRRYHPSNQDDCGNDIGFATGRLKVASRHNYIPNPDSTKDEIDVTVSDNYTYATGAGWLSKKSTVVTRGSQAQTFSQQYTYSDLGLPQSVTYPGCSGCGSTALPARSVSSSYSYGLVTAIPGYANAISYYANGLFQEIQLAGANGLAGVVDVQLNDPEGRTRPLALYTRNVLSADGTHPDDWNPNGAMTYSYDVAGNVSAVGELNPANPEYRLYRYDSMSRIRKANVGGQTIAYTYDRWGNLQSGAVDPGTNRLAGSAYDALGNLTGWSSYLYKYDSLNAMTYVNGPLSERMYVYDADGERVGTIDNRLPSDTPDGPPGRSETWTIRGVNKKVLRVVENRNNVWTWKKDYVYRGSALLASEGPEGTRHFHLDHLGTVRMITDPATRRVVSRHVYFPFGEEISDPDSDNERMKFAGHERDNLNPAALGRVGDLDYMHARFHNPSMGRFLSVDPVGGTGRSSQSWNRYSYANNSPLLLVDPDGMVEKPTSQPVDEKPATTTASGSAKVDAVSIPTALGFTRDSGTFSIGPTVSVAGYGLYGTGSVALNVDRSGETSLSGTLGGGWSAGWDWSGGLQTTVTNGRSVDDLGGTFFVGGGDAGLAESAGWEAVIGNGGDGHGVLGFSGIVGLGFGTEVHLGETQTWQIKWSEAVEKVRDLMVGAESALTRAACAYGCSGIH